MDLPTAEASIVREGGFEPPSTKVLSTLILPNILTTKWSPSVNQLNGRWASRGYVRARTTVVVRGQAHGYQLQSCWPSPPRWSGTLLVRLLSAAWIPMKGKTLRDKGDQ